MKRHLVAAVALSLSLAALLAVGCESVGLRSMRIYMQQQNWAKALEEGRDAVAENPNDAEAWFAIAQVAAEVDSIHLMIHAMNRTTSLTHKHDADIKRIRESKYSEVFNKGVAKYNAGDLKAAMDYLVTAIAIDSTKAPAWKVRAMIYHRSNELSEALASYSRAYQIDPKDVDVAHAYALLLDNAGKHAEARKVADAFYAAHPTNKEAVLTKVQFLADDSLYSQAISVLDSAIRRDSTVAAYSARAGIVYMEMAQATQDTTAAKKDLSAAVPYLRSAYAKDSTNTDVAYDLALSLLQIGRRHEALDPLRGILRQNPKDYSARLQLCQIYLQSDEADSAEPHLKMIVDGIGDPTNAEQRSVLSRAYRYLGIIYTLRGNKLDEQSRALAQEVEAMHGRAHDAEKKAKQDQIAALEKQAHDLFDQSEQMMKKSDDYNN